MRFARLLADVLDKEPVAVPIWTPARDALLLWFSGHDRALGAILVVGGLLCFLAIELC